MRVVPAFVGGCTLALLSACPFITSAHAQETKPAAPRGPEERRTEVYNGPIRTVTYDLTGLSPRLQALYRQLELAENELSLTGQLGALKQEYVNNERKLESRRTWLQLYGYPGSGALGPAYRGIGGYGGGVLKSTIAPTLGLGATAGYRQQVIFNVEEAQRAIAEEERERTPSRQPAGAEKARPPASLPAPAEKKPPPPPAAKPTDRSSKNEPSPQTVEQVARWMEHVTPAKVLQAAARDPQQADPESLAKQIREQFARTSRELGWPVPATSGEVANPVAQALWTVPRPSVAPQEARTGLSAQEVGYPPPPESSWSERLGWLSAGAMGCVSLFTLGWSLRRRMGGRG